MACGSANLFNDAVGSSATRPQAAISAQGKAKEGRRKWEGERREYQSAARGLHWDGMVVRCSGRCHPALGQARDLELLHPLRGKTQNLRRKISLLAGRELRGDAG